MIRVGSLGVLLALSGGASASAVLGSSTQDSPPVFEAAVALVAVPVFVTDGAGKAVPGLTADDFEVHDGGRRVPVVAFQAVDVDAPAVAAEGSSLPVTVQAAARRQFLFLFDLQFSPPAGLTRARRTAMRFVQESLGAGDLVAVATFGRRGLEMLTNFTTDRDWVARAIEGLGIVRGHEEALDPLGLSGSLDVPTGGEGFAALADEQIAAEVGELRLAARRQYQQRVIDFLGSVEDLAKALSPLRGRKQIVLLSGGFDEWASMESPGAATPDERYQQNKLDQTGALAVRQRMSQMFRQAGVSDVVIHSVDLRGLEGPVDVASPSGRNEARGEGRGALAALAAETGGRSIRPTNDFGRALREVDEVSRHYYVLAFQPAEPGPKPGRPRDVKVRVRRDGLRVSHRAAYVLPKSSPAPDAESVRRAAAEAIAKGLSGGSLGLRLVAMPYRDGAGQPSVPAVLHVDGAALFAAARGDRLDVQVYGYAFGAGRVLDTMVAETTLDLSKARTSLQNDGLRLLTVFAAAPGPIELRFVARAGPSGEMGFLRARVEVPAFVPGQAELSPPMPTLPITGRLVAPYHTRGRPPLEIPFRLGSELFLPDASPTLAAGVPRDLCVFAWPARTRSGPRLEVAGEMAQPGEAPLPLGIESARIVADSDGFDRYVVTVLPPLAPPGRYTLRLTFGGPGERSMRTEMEVALRE